MRRFALGLLCLTMGCFGSLVVSIQAAQDGVATDRAALVALHSATNGAGWTEQTGWSSDEPLGQWHGVSVNADGRVTGLDLYDNALSGPIPAAIADLADLETLDLSDNRLDGPILATIGNLASLQYLDLSDNELSGPIPAAIGDLANLRYLWMAGNALSGPVPGEIGNLAYLEALGLGDRTLSGPLPLDVMNAGRAIAAGRTLGLYLGGALCAPAEARFQAWLATAGVRLFGDTCPTSWSFADPTLVVGVTPIKAVHFAELREAIDAVRTRRCGLSATTWTDPTLLAGVTPVRGVHVLELRQGLTEAYRSCSLQPLPAYTDAVLSGQPIRAAHVLELRAAVDLALASAWPGTAPTQ